MNDEGAAPGWYASGNGQQRYWDGHSWTAHVASPPPPQPGYAVAPYAAGLHAGPGGHGVVIQPKSPGVALLCSFFIPGLGQFVNGDAGKGVGFLLAYLVSWLLVFILIGIPMLFIVWIWAMADAYSGARRWNLQRGIIS